MLGKRFNRDMFIMLVSIMVGAIIITYFIADLQKETEFKTFEKTLKTEHQTEIGDINSRNENFTKNFLQGAIILDSARETREVGNYYFDLAAKIWYPEQEYQKVIDNCTEALSKYLTSNQKFLDSKPYYIAAKTFTDNPSYHGVIDYYVNFTDKGMEITQLRYDMTLYLKHAAENLSLGFVDNATILMANFSELQSFYSEMLSEYDELKDYIDDYFFFEEDRTKPGI